MYPMTIPLEAVSADRVLGDKTTDYCKNGVLPERMRWLDTQANIAWEELRRFVVVSDMYRSAESSLWAIQNRKGAQPPGWSGHGYGRCVDINILQTMKNVGAKSKRALDSFMLERGWYCHLTDGTMAIESWHYNYLGVKSDFVRPGDKATSVSLERFLRATYSQFFTLINPELQAALAKLGLYGGSIDGILGPQSKQAITKFRETWKITEPNIFGPKTQRCLSFVTAQKS